MSYMGDVNVEFVARIGHYATEPGLADAMVHATDKFQGSPHNIKVFVFLLAYFTVH